MKTRDIKTIDVVAYEWFDKVNGNSYFAGHITINLSRKNSARLIMPFQYGYGDQYRHEAYKVIKEKLNCFKTADERETYWRVYEDQGIIARHTLYENCKKRRLMEIA